MGWFKKDKKKEGIPTLPKLPSLPEVHLEEHGDETLPKLPSIPSNELGNRFSQNMIKEAVIGEKEEKDVEEEIEDFEMPMNVPPHLPLTKEIYPEPKRTSRRRKT